MSILRKIHAFAGIHFPEMAIVERLRVNMGTVSLISILLLFHGLGSGADVVRGEDRFEFKYCATLPPLDGKAEMWVPLAKSDPFQTLEAEQILLPTGWRKIEDRDYKNQIVALKLDSNPVFISSF